MLSICIFVTSLLAAVVAQEGMLGYPCGQDSDCRVDGSYCYLDWQSCRCKEGYSEDSSWTKCLKKAERYGDSCETSWQCQDLGPMAQCDHNVCDCQIPFIPNADNTDCVPEPKKLIGESCSRDDQCVGHPGSTSGCTSTGMCSCRHRNVASAALDDCLEISYGLGSYCSEKQQCQQGNSGPNSDCLYSRSYGTNICNCDKDHTIDIDGNECLPKATTIGDSCTINNQCIANLKHSHCLKGECQCMTPYVFSQSAGKCGTAADDQDDAPPPAEDQDDGPSSEDQDDGPPAEE